MRFALKVLLPGIDAKKGTIWARLASPDAGNERGFFFRPEPGDEVVVGFFNDDPRQAVILGAVYGAKNKPPRSLGKPTKENKDKSDRLQKSAMIGFLDDEKPRFLSKRRTPIRLCWTTMRKKFRLPTNMATPLP